MAKLERRELAPVRAERNLAIPLRDGTTLRADLFRPEGVERCPVLVSYYPYHKDDLIGSFCEFPRRYFAERGYANLLVDFRGLGSSEGVAWHAMDAREDLDGAEVVEWAARQPWSDGNVGVWGVSYGGITALKIAARQPPHLKAIVPIYASGDIYRDYVYPGGCLNCLGAFGAWGSFMLAMNLMPPTLQDPENNWYRIWMERLETSEPYILPWQEHPEHDGYWQSRVIPAGKIEVPTFLIGGWRDIFPDRMPALFKQISGPKKLWMGPWMHNPPDVSPYEKIDYLAQMLRWWDRWLAGDANGIDAEPPVTVFVQGRQEWKHENEWPIARSETQTLYLAAGGRLEATAPTGECGDPYRAVPSVGAQAGLWDPTALGLGHPIDQGPDDLRSLTYTSEPLSEALEISGAPEALLCAALESGDDANWVVKLCDVAPDGSSALITTGWLRAQHHRGHREALAIEPGKRYEFRVPMWATSYEIPAGHRLRIAVSCSDFPRIWPTPTNPAVRLWTGGGTASSVHLPVVPAGAAVGPPMALPDPTPNRAPLLTDFEPRWTILRDLAEAKVTVSTGSRQRITLPTGGSFEMDHLAAATVRDDRPDSARLEGKTRIRLDLPASGPIEVETRSWVSRDRMLLSAEVTLAGQLLCTKRWQR